MERDSSQAEQVDNFKPVFKKYKRRDQSLDLTDVIDLEKLTDSSSNLVRHVQPVVPSLTPVVGLKPAQHWSILLFLNHPGFYVIQNPFLPGSQRYWASRCLQDLPRPPNVTNLTVHPDLDPDTLWTSFLTDFHHRGSEAYNSSSPLRKLRWTTIGYHYHWDTKEYREEDHTPFPQDIGVLAHYVARVLGFLQFQAEAGIINFYHHDSSLAAHTDHSELDHQAPLFSISFGQDAVFLMGGLTKAQTPTALRLHSGDICVMSGEARLAYHAVPRILPSPSCTPPPCFDMTPADWKGVEGWAGGGGDPADCVGDMLPSPPTECSQAVSEQSGGLPRPIASASEERDSHRLATNSSVHISTSADHAESASGESDSLSAAKDSSLSTCMSTHNTKNPSEESDPHTVSSFSKSSSQHLADRPSDGSDRHTAASDSPFSAQTTTQHPENPGQKVDSQTAWYEDSVRMVNLRLINTLQQQDWRPFAAYLSQSRLNVNIRQVLKAGHTFDTADRQGSPVHVKKARTEIPS